MSLRGWIGSMLLLLMLAGAGGGLAAWKIKSIQEANAASANQPEPIESVAIAVAKQRAHRRTTTSIGTVLALRSITLRNELAGMVREAKLVPGQIVEAGTVLVALDVSVEQAELKAQEAQAALAQITLGRMKRLGGDSAVAQNDVDRARTEHDVALAQIARTKAIIARKTIRAPFRARVGMADVHPGQYLEEGTQLTTLQGVDDAVHVDFAVPQWVATTLRKEDTVVVSASGETTAGLGRIIALDARIDPTTRNALVRARIDGDENMPAPGASVRVEIPVGPPGMAVSIPVNALRKGPAGAHVFVIAKDKSGKTRARLRTVESGTMLGDEVLIYKGLSPGEQVAASGSFKLREDVLVAIAGNALEGTGEK